MAVAQWHPTTFGCHGAVGQPASSHWKRVTKLGDALYGVLMRGDGVSAVISQRLREEETA